mgnify:CR=1 FL=1
MYKIDLQWKEFNVDLESLDQQLRSDYSTYVGNQANSLLELWFSEEPNQEEKDAINTLWNAIDIDHAMTQSYKSASQIKSEKDSQKASAKAKLAALGLTEDELQALLG